MSDLTRKDEFDTIQRQLASVGDSRISLLSEAEEEKSPRGRERRRKRERQTMTALKMLLRDQEYAALYNAVGDLLDDAERKTETAIAAAEADLQDTLDRAARLPNGAAVFRDANGDIRGEDGKIITPEDAAGIEWPDGAPSYAEYTQRRDRLDELRRYQVEVLGHAGDRMNDEDNPAQKDELRQLENAIQDGLNSVVHQKDAEDHTPESTHERSSEVTVLKL